MTTVQNHDFVRHSHGFDLVVGHIDSCRLQALMQLPNFCAHLNTKLGVKVGQGFVKKENLRISHNGSTHRHPLPLSPRQRTGIALKIWCQAKNFSCIRDLAFHLGLINLPEFQRKTHVRFDRFVRI